MDIIELKWDSDHFGEKIGEVVVGRDELFNDVVIEQKMRDGNYDLLYIYSDYIIPSRNEKMYLVDKKRSYYLIPQGPIDSFTKSGMIVEDYCGDPDKLYALAYQAGYKSRFKVDPNFTEETFKKLYRRWIDNSINGNFADYVKIVKKDDTIIGFVTAKKKGRFLSIGLIAVDSASRSKGIGKLLVQDIINIAHKCGFDVEVTTQADNISACAFYEKFGFTINDETLIYHLWRS